MKTNHIQRYKREAGWARLALVLGLLALAPLAFAFLGDVDGDNDVDATDAQQVIEAAVGFRVLTPVQKQDADVDGDSDADMADAQLIQQFAAGVITQFPPRKPQNSGPIAMRRDGSMAGVVNPDSGTISFIDGVTDAKIAEVRVGREPSGIAFSRDGRKAYVTNARDANVAVIDTQSFSVTNTIAVGVEPFGIVVNFRGDTAYVTNVASASVSVVNLSTETVTASVAVAEKPQAIAVTADSGALYVTHLTVRQVSRIDTQNLSVSSIALTEIPFDPLNSTQPAGKPNRLKGITLHPTLNQAWLPHILSNSGNTVETLFNSSIFPAVSVLNTATNQEVTNQRMTLFAGLSTVVSGPEAVAFSPDGTRAYLISATSNDLTVINTATRQQIGLLRDVGDNPRGIVVSPSGAKAYVFSRLSPVVTVVNLNTETIQSQITVSTPTLPPNIDNGRRLFFTSALPEVAKDRFFSCESCHFDGRDDGQTWFFTNGPRQALSMAGGTLNTGLLHHNADRIDVPDFAATFTRLQNGTGVTPDQLSDLADFVNSGIRFLANPSLSAAGGLTADARAGRRLFRGSAGCSGCHSGPFLTDATGHTDISKPLLHDVGIFAPGTGAQDETDKTRDQAGVAGGTVRPAGAFESTTLLNVWATAPYLHDGRAATLLETLTTHNVGDTHGVTSGFSAIQLNQLVSYLRQIDITNSRVQITLPKDGARIVTLSQVSGTVLPEVTQVEVFINGAGPILATVSNGVFSASVPPALVPPLANGANFDITAQAVTTSGETGRDDIAVSVNYGAGVSASTSSVDAAPALLTVGGTASALVTVTPRDASSNMVGTGLSIEVQASAGGLGAVRDNGDGTYSATLTSAQTAGTATLSARVQGGAFFTDTAQVRFAAADVDANASNVSADPFTLEANRIASAQISIVPRDAFGNLLGAGQSVSVSVNTGTVGVPVDQGDGSYLAMYTAPAVLGTATLTAVVNGVTLTNRPQIILTADVTAPPPADLSAIGFGTPTGGISTITGGAGAVEPFASVTITNVTQNVTQTVVAGANGSFVLQLAVTSNDQVRVLVTDLAGHTSTTVQTVPFPVAFFAVRGVVQAAQPGGGFAPAGGARVELDIANLADPSNPVFSPVFAGGQFLTGVSAADGTFSIVLPNGFVPDPDLAVVTGPDADNNGLVDTVGQFALVNAIERTVLVDEISSTIMFMIGSNDELLNLATPFPATNFTATERTAIENTTRAATAQIDFSGGNALQQIADDIFFDVDGPKDNLDTVAYATFEAAAQSPGAGVPPVFFSGTLSVPGTNGPVPLAGVPVDLATLSFFNGTSCTTPICVAPIAGSTATTDNTGRYTLKLPGFAQPGSSTVMVAIGDLTYSGAGVPGPFNSSANVFSLGGFVTDPAQAVDIDVIGRVAMSLIQVMNVPIGNFSPGEIDQLTALLRAKIPAAGIVLSNRTLQQVFTAAFNAMFADSAVLALLNQIKEPPAGDNSRVTASPTVLQADGASVSTISIEPLAANSERVGPGLVIDMSTTSGRVTTPAIDHGDGLYTAYLTAPVSTNPNTATVTARIAGSNLAQKPVINLIPDSTAPATPNNANIVLVNVGTTATVIGLPGAVEPNSQVVIQNLTQGVSVTVTANADGSFRVDLVAQVGDQLRLTSVDAAGNSSAAATRGVDGGLALPAIANPAVVSGATPTITTVARSAFQVALPAGYTFLAGVDVNLGSGNATAALNILATSTVPVPAGKMVVLLEQISVQQQPVWRVVDQGFASGGVLFTKHLANAVGMSNSGRFMFVAADNALAFVHGAVTGNRGPIGAVRMSLTNSPFADLSRADGRYLIAGVVGSASNVSAQLFTHQSATSQGVQLPYGGAEARRDFALNTRADTALGFTQRFVGVGQVARDMQLLPSGDQLYVALNNVGDFAIINAPAMQQVSLAEDGANIEDFAFTPNGFEAFIGYFNRVRDFTVNIEEPGLITSNVAFPRVLAINPNGELALIASSLDNIKGDSNPDAVYVLDTFSNVLEAGTLPIPADPVALKVNSSGTRAYVLSEKGTLTVINLSTRSVISTINVGTQPADVVLAHNGAELYVTDSFTNQVKVISAALAEDAIPNNEITRVITVGSAPGALALTPDGTTLLVAEQQSDTVTLINLTLGTVARVFATVDVPFDLAVQGNGTVAYVLDPLTRRGVLEIPLAANDSFAPRVVDVGPQDRTQSLLQDSPIEIVFSEKMDTSTLSNVNIQVLDQSSNPIAGTLAASGNGVVAIFTPATGTRYVLSSQVTVQIGANVKDTAGNALGSAVPRVVPVQVMQVPNLLRISVDLSNAGITANGSAGAVHAQSQVLVTNLTTNQVFSTVAAPDGSFSLKLQGLDNDGYQLVTRLFNGRAQTNPVPLPVNFNIVIPNPVLMTYTPGNAGTLNLTGAAGAVDPQSSRITVNNLTSGQSFSTTTVNANGSFQLGIFAKQGDTLTLTSVILGAITLDPVPLSVPNFAPPVIAFLSPDRFVFGDPQTLLIVGTAFGDTPGHLRVKVGGTVRTDFTLEPVDQNPSQRAIVLGLAAGTSSGAVSVAYAGQTSNTALFSAELPQNTSPFGEQVISSANVTNAAAALGQTDNLFADLGQGGEIVIRLGSVVTDGPGNDLQIFEDTADSPDCYQVLVSPSSVGPFVALGNFCGTTSVNLNGQTDVRFIKIVDANDGGNPARIDGMFVIRVRISTQIQILDGLGNVIQTVGARPSSTTLGLFVPNVSVSIDPSDTAICETKSMTLKANASPEPSGGGGYGGGCSDSFVWKTDIGTLSPSGSTATFTADAGTLGKTANVEVTVTRSGSCSSTGTSTSKIKIDIPKFEFVNPKDDPVSSPVKDQNEFTFDDKSPGVLMIKFDAKATPGSQLDKIKDKVKFTIEAIGSSTKTWKPALNGQAELKGNFKAELEFKGLPSNNSDFGKKKVTVECDGVKQQETTIEVFFTRDAKNHPGGKASDPNWFYYWAQTPAGDPDLVYSATANFGETPAMLNWRTYSGSRDRIDVSDQVTGSDTRRDGSGQTVTGIDLFATTVAHENHHVSQIHSHGGLPFYAGKTGPLSNSAASGWSFNVPFGNAYWNHFTDSDGSKGYSAGDTDLDVNRNSFGDSIEIPAASLTKCLSGTVARMIECDAELHETILEDTHKDVDWGSPGKQHDTSAYND